MEEIIYNKDQGVATITLNRPTKFNSVNRKLALDWQEAMKDCADDESIRCLVISGNGRAFCAGQDLGEIIDPNGPELDKIVQEHFNPIIKMIRGLKIPVIAAVNGVAAGAGANIAMACDVVIASDRATFLQAFSKIGLLPDSGGTYSVPRAVGVTKASGLIMLADNITAREAERIGMVYKVVHHIVFDSYIKRLAKKLSLMPTKSFELTKSALDQTYKKDMEEMLELEDKYQTILGHTSDYGEGVRAFLEKRKPIFQGK